jgi:hypothetical protein
MPPATIAPAAAPAPIFNTSRRVKSLMAGFLR